MDEVHLLGHGRTPACRCRRGCIASAVGNRERPRRWSRVPRPERSSGFRSTALGDGGLEGREERAHQAGHCHQRRLGVDRDPRKVGYRVVARARSPRAGVCRRGGAGTRPRRSRCAATRRRRTAGMQTSRSSMTLCATLRRAASSSLAHRCDLVGQHQRSVEHLLRAVALHPRYRVARYRRHLVQPARRQRARAWEAEPRDELGLDARTLRLLGGPSASGAGRHGRGPTIGVVAAVVPRIRPGGRCRASTLCSPSASWATTCTGRTGTPWHATPCCTMHSDARSDGIGSPLFCEPGPTWKQVLDDVLRAVNDSARACCWKRASSHPAPR